MIDPWGTPLLTEPSIINFPCTHTNPAFTLDVIELGIEF